MPRKRTDAVWTQPAVVQSDLLLTLDLGKCDDYSKETPVPTSFPIFAAFLAVSGFQGGLLLHFRSKYMLIMLVASSF